MQTPPLKVVAALLCSYAPLAQTSQIPKPDRIVRDTTIMSTHDPSITIQLPKDARYVGADRLVLYNIADCEIQVFVQADEHRNVKQLYWVQFEGYLPSLPDMHHTYDSPRHLQISGLDFYVDTWVRAADAPTRSGSDREHVTKLLESHGYKMPPNTMDVRLVHLLDDQKRKELMIIYSEDLAPTGLTAAELDKDGKAHSQWPSLENGLIQRAKEKIQLH